MALRRFPNLGSALFQKRALFRIDEIVPRAAHQPIAFPPDGETLLCADAETLGAADGVDSGRNPRGARNCRGRGARLRSCAGRILHLRFVRRLEIKAWSVRLAND